MKRKKKSLTRTYSEIRSAIAFIMRDQPGLSKHLITEAATKAAGILHGINNNKLRGQHGTETATH